MMFGSGDHMLDHLSHALCTFPVFLGMGPLRVRPLAVDDVVQVLIAALLDGRLPRQTIGLVGPSEMSFDDAARLVASVIGKKRVFLRAPSVFHELLARTAETLMTVPLISRAQVRILEEEVIEAVGAPDYPPDDLVPMTLFDQTSISAGLPELGPFGLADLRWFATRHAHDGT
jgi:NADH dehydrogenase